jgi:hypothetical protein
MKSKSDLKIKYGDNIIDEIENKLAKEISDNINKDILNSFKKPSKIYLLSLVENINNKEGELFILMEKYGIIENDLYSLEIVKSKIREYNIDLILKNN